MFFYTFLPITNIKESSALKLNKHQQFLLMKFNRESPLKLVQCDKNIGSALISDYLHDQMALNHLLDKDTYHQPTIDPLDRICNKIQLNIENLINNKPVYVKLK
jgi:hypothetical protein